MASKYPATATGEFEDGSASLHVELSVSKQLTRNHVRRLLALAGDQVLEQLEKAGVLRASADDENGGAGG